MLYNESPLRSSYNLDLGMKGKEGGGMRKNGR